MPWAMTPQAAEVMAEASAAREAESVKHRLRRACPPVESGWDGLGGGRCVPMIYTLNTVSISKSVCK